MEENYLAISVNGVRWCHLLPKDRMEEGMNQEAYLIAKLVARETQHNQPSRIFALQLVHLGVVPHSCASEGGHIFYQDHSSSEIVEIHFLPLEVGGIEVIKGFGYGSHHGCKDQEQHQCRSSEHLTDPVTGLKCLHVCT